jgi:GNAT superfamily N-acetyltransferase
MTRVLQLTKILVQPPAEFAVPGVSVRTYRGPADIGPWLELRHRAFARQSVGVRSWNARDFAAELLDKPWWGPERLWLAERDEGRGAGTLIGAVALAERAQARPAVHWLMVDPAQRRHGVGRLLMTTLEAWCWQAGQRQIWLETHAAWEAAARLYRTLGYVDAIGD